MNQNDESRQPLEHFEKDVRSLAAGLADLNIEYAVIGGLAVILRGYDRVTVDLDAVLLEADLRLQEILDVLDDHGFHSRVQQPLAFASKNRILLLVSESGLQVDLSLGLLPFEETLVKHADDLQVAEGLTLPVARVQDLIVMKLVAGRQRDVDDIKRLLELHKDVDRKAIRAQISEFAPLLEEVDLVGRMESILEPDSKP